MKIKNENDLLGYLLKNCDSSYAVDNASLVENCPLDSVSLNKMIASLAEKCHVVKTMDKTTITTLGKNNYVSIKDRIFSWLITLLKFVVSYTLGVFSGVIATWLVVYLGIG